MTINTYNVDLNEVSHQAFKGICCGIPAAYWYQASFIACPAYYIVSFVAINIFAGFVNSYLPDGQQTKNLTANIAFINLLLGGATYLGFCGPVLLTGFVALSVFAIYAEVYW